jgi:hypothetical protein
MKRPLLILVVPILIYAGSYVWFRNAHLQRWDRDGHDYVIFPEQPRAWYYFYRPLTYLDGRLTGMRFHIGPH